MADLASRVGPLLAMAEQVSGSSADGPVRLEQEPFLTQVNLRGRPDDPAFIEGAKTALGLSLPVVANTTAGTGDRRALWLGPDEWMLVGPDGDQSSMIARLTETLEGQHVSIVDVSANRTTLRLSGSRARDVLEKGCLIDLHPRNFGSGQCVGTIIAKTQVYLEQLDDLPTYRLHVRCSFARHLTARLRDSMAEFVTS